MDLGTEQPARDPRGDATDRDLATVAQRGDREAFDTLVERYADRLFRFLRMRALSESVAEDLVQDTLVQCWRSLARFDPTRSFSSWLFKLGANLATSSYRRGRRDPILVAEDRPAGPDPAAVVLLDDARNNLWDVVHAHLPPEARASLWLFYGESKSAAEIGEILGKSEGAVRVLLLRARTRLAGILQRDALSLETR
ncbi:MAG: sigma-70 family RNA polymerase sigma factor [Planctomycetota bacterium]